MADILMESNAGFITIVEQANHSLLGGFLVLTPAGRPLEFHCTVPVAADRIQEILYGETLQPFLYGEKIAPTLLKRSKLPISCIFTNIASVLLLQHTTDVPVIYVFDDKKLSKLPQDKADENLKIFGIEQQPVVSDGNSTPVEHVPPVLGLDTSPWQTVRIGNRFLAVPAAHHGIIQQLMRTAVTMDYAEPFTRIRLAIGEASRSAA